MNTAGRWAENLKLNSVQTWNKELKRFLEMLIVPLRNNIISSQITAHHFKEMTWVNYTLNSIDS